MAWYSEVLNEAYNSDMLFTQKASKHLFILKCILKIRKYDN